MATVPPADAAAFQTWQNFEYTLRLRMNKIKPEQARDFGARCAAWWGHLSNALKQGIPAAIQVWNGAEKEFNEAVAARKKWQGKPETEDSLDSLEKLVERRKACIAASKALHALLGQITAPGYEQFSRIRLNARQDGLTNSAKAEAAELVRVRGDLEERRKRFAFSPLWVGGWHLGAGSFGKAHLWIKQNKVGQITDVSSFTSPF